MTLVYAKKNTHPEKKKHKKHSSPSKKASHRKKAPKSTTVLLKALTTIPVATNSLILRDSHFTGKRLIVHRSTFQWLKQQFRKVSDDNFVSI